MVVKIYVSGISGNKEVKKRQQRVLMILDSKSIKYDVIDITEPGREADKDFMQSNAKSNGATVSDPNPRSALPPQIFNDDEYCGDYDQFDMSNEVDTLEQFLKVEAPPQDLPQEENKENDVLNGDVAEKEESKSKESSQEREPASKEETPAEEGTPLRDATPTKDSTAAKEGSPTKEGSPAKEEEAKSKESSPEKEASPERQKSVEKEGTPSEKAASAEKKVDDTSTKPSKESSPEVNENGTVSSREQSAEKEAVADADIVERKKDNPSESLIESEQAISAD